MATNEKSDSPTANREIISTRLINAPRELVFSVWTDPKHIKKWWGPDGFTNTIHKMEVKPGGQWSFVMHGPDGTNYKNEIVFKEVLKPERLVYRHISHPPFDVEVTFEDVNGKTKLTMQMVFESAEALQKVVQVFNAIEGQQQTLNRLEKYLEKLHTNPD